MNGKRKYKLLNSGQNEFVPIRTSKDKSVLSYGGAQAWWSADKNIKSTGDSCGCGVIAAANLMFYVSLNPDNDIELVDSITPVDKDYYMSIADELWGFIEPYTGFKGFRLYSGTDPYMNALKLYLGVTTRKLIKGLKRFTEKRGYQLEFNQINSFWSSMEKGRNFIKKYLSEDSPVLLMSVRNDIKEYKTHWVIITEYEENIDKEEYFVTISTWGKRKEKVDFSKLWKSGLFLKFQYMITVSNINKL